MTLALQFLTLRINDRISALFFKAGAAVLVFIVAELPAVPCSPQ